jgi:hypothetical protein
MSFAQGQSPRALGSCSLLRICGCSATNSQVRSQISAVVCGTPPVMSRSDNTTCVSLALLFVTGEIPSSLSKLEKLENLYLHGNALSGETNIFGTPPVMSRVHIASTFIPFYTPTTTHSNHHSLEPPLAPTTTRTDHHSHRPPLAPTTTRTEHHSRQPPLAPTTTRTDHHSHRPPLAPTTTRTEHHSRRPPLAPTTTPSHNSSRPPLPPTIVLKSPAHNKF